MKITKRQLRQIISESLLLEQEAPSWPGDDAFIQELLPFVTTEMWAEASQLAFHYGLSYNDLLQELDDSDWMDTIHYEHKDLPKGWREKVENAAWKIESARQDELIANDPDKQWLKLMGSQWSSSITPEDMESLGWKEYKRYVRLKPPYSISHGVGEINIPWEDIERVGPREEFIEFLDTRAGVKLQKRPAYPKPTPPLYD
jgi:hypothetical protein